MPLGGSGQAFVHKLYDHPPLLRNEQTTSALSLLTEADPDPNDTVALIDLGGVKHSMDVTLFFMTLALLSTKGAGIITEGSGGGFGVALRVAENQRFRAAPKAQTFGAACKASILCM